MDIDIRIIQHKDFLRMTPNGELNMEQSKQLVLRLASLNKPPNNRDALLDFRNTTSQITITDIAMLVQVMMKHRESFRSKLAILTEPGDWLELAKFVEGYAKVRGFQVAAFDSFEAAILWLATITEVKPENE